MGEVFIVCDIGTNWLSDMKLMKKLIKECRDAGADAVKPQLWPHTIYSSENNPFYDLQKRCELSFEQAQEIFNFGKEIGIEVFFSVFDEERVEWCEKIGAARYKIAAGARDITLISKVVDTGKPIIMSLKPNEKPPFFFRTHPLCECLYRTSFLYCVPKYPADYSDYKLPYFPNPPIYAGISDHTLGIVTSLTAVARGATIVEKHVMPEGGVYSPDACVSITISELEDLVKYTRVMEKML